MERMWRRVNHSFGYRSPKSALPVQSSTNGTNLAILQESTPITIRSAMKSDAQAPKFPASHSTGRRLAAACSQIILTSPTTANQCKSSFSQHIIQSSTASSERRRRRRRTSRARRSGISCMGGGGIDKMSSSSGLCALNDISTIDVNTTKNLVRHIIDPSKAQLNAAARSDSVLVYPNTKKREYINFSDSSAPLPTKTLTSQDISLRQRAVAKLRTFNFNLNWDLHVNHCKPCGPRFRGGGGNILTRRLCRNRKSEDNELYRSNSFKFERFERKEISEELTESLKKKIAICDEYSLPVDFVKKRPSNFNTCLAECLKSKRNDSPCTDCCTRAEKRKKEVKEIPKIESSTFETTQPLNEIESSTINQNYKNDEVEENKIRFTRKNYLIPKRLHQPLEEIDNYIPKPETVTLFEGYSNPRDYKTQQINYRRRQKKHIHKTQGSKKNRDRDKIKKHKDTQNKITNISDSSFPNTSEDDSHIDSTRFSDLYSSEGTSVDLILPFQTQVQESLQKITVPYSEENKQTQSPYYYSDLLKSKETRKPNSKLNLVSSVELKKISAILEKSDIDICNTKVESTLAPDQEETKNRPKESLLFDSNCAYGGAIEKLCLVDRRPNISGYSPETTTSEESDCSECERRREWHSKALDLVRKTCNIKPINLLGNVKNLKNINQAKPSSMSPKKYSGLSVCACTAPISLNAKLNEYFQPNVCFLNSYEVDGCSEPLSVANNINITETSCIYNSSNFDDEMSGRTNQIYETAFDCRVPKSDDDLDEVDRITNQAMLLQLNTESNLNVNTNISSTKNYQGIVRVEEKRIKNSKNHVLQHQLNQSVVFEYNVNNTLNSTKTDVVDVFSQKITQNINNDANGLLKPSPENESVEEKIDDQPFKGSALVSQCSLVSGYTPTSLSTASVIKLTPKNETIVINSIRSTSFLPSKHIETKDSHHQRSMTFKSSTWTDQESSSLIDTNRSSKSSCNNLHTKLLYDRSRERQCLKENKIRSKHRPRTFVPESDRVVKLRKIHNSHAKNQRVRGNSNKKKNFSSTESIMTLSSGGSMESLLSSTSDGNRSTSSCESRQSISLSSHSSESGSCGSVGFPLRVPVTVQPKLHILSPISDKSLEPSSELCELNKTKKLSPEGFFNIQNDFQQELSSKVSNEKLLQSFPHPNAETQKKKKVVPNKALINLHEEILGSDSGISLNSRDDRKFAKGLENVPIQSLTCAITERKDTDNSLNIVCSINNIMDLPQDLHDLPFDMPKLRRKKTLQTDGCTSGSATSVNLGDQPFDMPKLRRRFRQGTNLSGAFQASSSYSMQSDVHSLKKDNPIFRPNLTLNFNEERHVNKFGSLDLHIAKSNKELNFNIPKNVAAEFIDVSIPLARQGWYHGAISRTEAEKTLRPLNEGSFLVRNCESTKQDYSLSLKGAKGFMHMRIQRNDAGQYIVGQFSRPFESVPEMIRHFCLNRLPVRGAEHMCLIEPVITQLL